MSADLMQLCLLLGVFVPLASFVFLVFFGTRLPGHGPPDEHHDDVDAGHAHAAADHDPAHHPVAGRSASDDPHASGAPHAAHHDGAHDFPPKVRRRPGGNPSAGWIATGAIGFSLLMAVVVFAGWSGQARDPQWRAAVARQAAASAVVWANLGPVPIEFGVKLDSLTVIMFLMVALCATCIHVFSIGYMRHDPRFARFFAYLSLFCFSMLGLVVARNLLFMFVFWELVGVCSYLLIGFWFEKKSASNAAIKAFVTNRVGDFGFLVGMMLCYAYLGTLSLDQAPAVFEAAAARVGLVAGGEPSPEALGVPRAQADRGSDLFRAGFLGVTLATWMGIGLFCGAIGKSAQFPLQVWLPDAMEGPTPVSALIHAATMVAAGVYLVGRIFTLLTPEAQMFIAFIGCVTLTLAALIAIVQVDIKRVLAYSTLSQLGYMVFAMGIGAWIAALFHLLTHAFFKALLFLGSGQVIDGCHHEQNMTRMGGLWRKMPRTALTFAVAVLAISGAGIPYLSAVRLGIGGFYSKDEILAVAQYRYLHWARDEGNARAPADARVAVAHAPPHERLDERVPRVVSDTAAARVAWDESAPRVVLAAHVQDAHAGPPAQHVEPAHIPPAAHEAPPHGDSHAGADYAARYPDVPRLPGWLYLLPVLVAYITPFYMGRCYILTFLGSPRDEHVYAHAHERNIMVWPLIVLAGMTFVSGPFIFRDFVALAAPAHPPMVPMIDGHDPGVHHAVHVALSTHVGFAFVVGLGLAWLVYRDGLHVAQRLMRLPLVASLHNVLWNKFYFDHVYDAVLVMGTRAVAVLCGVFDNWIIDGLVNLSARFTAAFSWFSGVVLDNLGVDGAVNGAGKLAWSVGGALRSTHTGVVRNYVLMSAIVVAGVVLSLWNVSLAVVFVVLAAAAVAAPAFCANVLLPLAVAAVLIRAGRMLLAGFGAAGAPAGGLSGDSFWAAYFRGLGGWVELVLLVVLFALLQLRLRNRDAGAPAWAAVPSE